MDTSALKKFAQEARRQLITQVTARMDQVLSMDSPEIREKEKAVNKFNELIHNTSKESVIDRVAYIWFNRFCALRFMDVNRYTNIGTVSPVEGYSQPEILQEAKQGHVDEDLVRFVDKQKVYDLLTGKIPSSDPQQEAFRLLLVGICNSYHALMPFMFEKIADYTELLMPEDLLSQNSILQGVRDALTEDNCKDVEIIGWLYQFYISEKKDDVFDGLKKNKKITPENIPAATQLFTPHWIVQYLVENSLGRLWMLNRPHSRLSDKMDYYIKPEQEENDFLKINSPEELKICDPACGSGHMLTYAFDLLYNIYEDEGYDPAVIPEIILNNNLYGIEIDERAGELAAFALTMKARAKQRRFFRKSVQPNICVLKNIWFEDSELKEYMDFVGRDLFTAPLEATLQQFEEAKNFGSLIRPDLIDVAGILKILDSKDVSGYLFLSLTHKKVLRVLQQADYLSPKYHVVVANPPYMGSKGMNGRLGSWAKDNYLNSKSDFFSMFVIRLMEMVSSGGFSGFMTPFNWMFLGAYEKFREFILDNYTITNLVRPEFHAFFDSAYVSICAFTLYSKQLPELNGSFIDLSRFYGADQQPLKTLEAIRDNNCAWFYRACTNHLKSIPGNLIAYWLSSGFKLIFQNSRKLSSYHFPKKGLTTGNNDAFIRLWFEVSFEQSTLASGHKWYPMTKGGNFRKWYGNNEYLLDWDDDGKRLKAFPGAVIRNEQFYLKDGGSWNDVTMASFSMRYTPQGFINNAVGPILYSDNILNIIGLLNSKVSSEIFKILSPTMKFEIGAVASFPIINSAENIPLDIRPMLDISVADWDAYETSWDFTRLPLLQPDYHLQTLKATYLKLRAHWWGMTLEMQRLEEENNRIFIEAYGLHDELAPDVPLNEITLTCNPYYRYNRDKNEKELEALLLSDTMKEFISYAVGCMFGRYSLDKLGLILANPGEIIDDYKKQIPNPTFDPDDDNVIPILDGDWFIDDIADRFRSFLRTTFGEEYYNENLKFLEQAIGKDIRKYFLKDFYNHHIKMYKKRPIYWMFSSLKGSFNALIYMHRYRPDMISIVLNNYLRESRSKITAKKENLEEISSSSSSSQRDKTKALKEIEKLKKLINELEGYERDILYPLATQQIEIDLDDGVKINYNKFGNALRKVAGLTD